MADLGERLDAIERRLDHIEEGVAQLLLGLTRTEEEDGSARRRPKLSEAQRRALQLEKAARMREAKAAKRMGLSVEEYGEFQAAEDVGSDTS